MTTKDEALKMIADIASGSTTTNSLQHIERIAREALEQPEQEPVVTRFPMKLTCTRCGAVDEGFLDVESETIPPHRKPLTEDEINEVLGGDICDEPSGVLAFARAIEAAHGVKE